MYLVICLHRHLYSAKNVAHHSGLIQVNSWTIHKYIASTTLVWISNPVNPRTNIFFCTCRVDRKNWFFVLLIFSLFWVRMSYVIGAIFHSASPSLVWMRFVSLGKRNNKVCVYVCMHIVSVFCCPPMFWAEQGSSSGSIPTFLSGAEPTNNSAAVLHMPSGEHKGHAYNMYVKSSCSVTSSQTRDLERLLWREEELHDLTGLSLAIAYSPYRHPIQVFGLPPCFHIRWCNIQLGATLRPLLHNLQSDNYDPCLV